jgi:hypothetical protein
MGVCVDDVLASVRGVVDLAPHEALDEAQDFLRRQGYSVTYRTTTTLTVKRQRFLTMRVGKKAFSS